MLVEIEKNEHRSTLKILGDVNVIAQGTLTKERMYEIHRDEFFFALGGGSFSSIKKFGETLIVAGKPHSSWFENGSIVSSTEERLYSPFLMGLDKTAKVSAFFQTNTSSPVQFETIYAQLAKHYPQGFAVVGYAVAAEFQGRYLKKAPIYHENMRENFASYMTDPFCQTDQPLSFFGVVIPPTTTFAKQLLDKGFYRDPQQANPFVLESHTHATLLAKKPLQFPTDQLSFFTTLQQTAVTSTAHLLTQSLIQKAFFGVYALDRIITN